MEFEACSASVPLCGATPSPLHPPPQKICWQHPTCTHPFNGPFSGTTRVSRYQKSKTNLDLTEARDSEWQWHQLGHMQVCTSLQTDNHTSTPPLSFLQAGCPSCHPTNSVKALKASVLDVTVFITTLQNWLLHLTLHHRGLIATSRALKQLSDNSGNLWTERNCLNPEMFCVTEWADTSVQLKSNDYSWLAVSA